MMALPTLCAQKMRTLVTLNRDAGGPRTGRIVLQVRDGLSDESIEAPGGKRLRVRAAVSLARDSYAAKGGHRAASKQPARQSGLTPRQLSSRQSIGGRGANPAFPSACWLSQISRSAPVRRAARRRPSRTPPAEPTASDRSPTPETAREVRPRYRISMAGPPCHRRGNSRSKARGSAPADGDRRQNAHR